jgi:hypothetical protein
MLQTQTIEPKLLELLNKIMTSEIFEATRTYNKIDIPTLLFER